MVYDVCLVVFIAGHDSVDDAARVYIKQLEESKDEPGRVKAWELLIQCEYLLTEPLRTAVEKAMKEMSK